MTERTCPIDPWDRIDRSAGPDGCWLWTGSVDRDGYGHFKVAGRMHRAARWVLTQKIGRALTSDEVTRHTCDNPPCCNPAHLLPGTAADNTADMIKRGRAITGDRHWTRRTPERLFGVANPAARLTEGQIQMIRARYAAGERQVPLAARYGVSQSLISRIVRRTSWRHIE